jgi:hypothetical protein
VMSNGGWVLGEDRRQTTEDRGQRGDCGFRISDGGFGVEEGIEHR